MISLLIVILMFHFSCVQTIAWMDFDHVCYIIILGSIEDVIVIFYKLNNYIFAVILILLYCIMIANHYMDVLYYIWINL